MWEASTKDDHCFLVKGTFSSKNFLRITFLVLIFSSVINFDVWLFVFLIYLYWSYLFKFFVFNYLIFLFKNNITIISSKDNTMTIDCNNFSYINMITYKTNYDIFTDMILVVVSWVQDQRVKRKIKAFTLKGKVNLTLFSACWAHLTRW